LTPNGEGAAVILAEDKITDSNVLFPKVSGWYEKHLGQKIVIVEDNREFFEIMLQPVDAPHKVNIVDTGEGLIQVLPVLVAGALAKAGSVLAIEEPESHLQPRYHAALAEYFIELVKTENMPKMLLETHSRNFLLRLQLAVAKQEIEPNLVRVYWVRQYDNGESVINEVNLDKLGGLLGEWDRDAFHSDVELSRQLIQAQREYL
jgi:predicted ATPase